MRAQTTSVDKSNKRIEMKCFHCCEIIYICKSPSAKSLYFQYSNKNTAKDFPKYFSKKDLNVKNVENSWFKCTSRFSIMKSTEFKPTQIKLPSLVKGF